MLGNILGQTFQFFPCVPERVAAHLLQHANRYHFRHATIELIFWKELGLIEVIFGGHSDSLLLLQWGKLLTMAARYNRTFGILYHGTTSGNADKINNEGFQTGNGGGGPGVYLTQTESDAKMYGDTVVPVMLTKGTLIHPEPYDDPSVSHLVGANTSQEDWNKIPEILSQRGWHGHVDYQGGKEHDHVVVYDTSRIKQL